MFCRTQRLLLRPGWADDAHILSQAWSDTSIAHHLPDLPASSSQEAAAEFLCREREAIAPYVLMFARTGGTPRLVGGCGVTHRADNRYDLSFWIARPYWGLGFATEAASAVIRASHAARIAPLSARPTTDNWAAIHVLDKLGFRPTGRFEKRFSPARGHAVSCALFEHDESGAMHGESHLVKECPALAA